MQPSSVADRFWAKVDARGICWEWTAAKTSKVPGKGYGVIRVNGRCVVAHRLAWELLVGTIPADRVVDHLCRNRLCVNPDHMEIVTFAENVRRGSSGLYLKHKTHCKRGHAFTPDNIYPKDGRHRECRTCRRLHVRAFRERTA